MNIALYAPMKPLDDPVPSGDRQVGRLIASALRRLGHEVSQPSRFRSWSRQGGAARQRDIEAAARNEAEIVLNGYRQAPRPDLWLTYHLYHKAPDWIGPTVADRLGIPYTVIEASRAAKRRVGPWSRGFAAADQALQRADVVAAMHADDAAGLAAVVPPARLRRLAPFIDATLYRRPAASPRPPATGPLRLLAVAMMRAGDKQASYELLAAALARLENLDWRLALVGDGPARDAILPLFPAGRTDWLGRLEPERLADVYASAELFVWPAIREAFGLVFLEAQAAGIPVIAGRSGGVPEIIRDGETGWLVPVGDALALTAALQHAWNVRPRLAQMGDAAARHVGESHDMAAGERGLAAVLAAACRHATAGGGEASS